jgi:hypothetical protein
MLELCLVLLSVIGFVWVEVLDAVDTAESEEQHVRKSVCD